MFPLFNLYLDSFYLRKNKYSRNFEYLKLGREKNEEDCWEGGKRVIYVFDNQTLIPKYGVFWIRIYFYRQVAR